MSDSNPLTIFQHPPTGARPRRLWYHGPIFGVGAALLISACQKSEPDRATEPDQPVPSAHTAAPATRDVSDEAAPASVSLADPDQCAPTQHPRCLENTSVPERMLIRTANLNGRGLTEFMAALCVLRADAPSSFGVIALQEVHPTLRGEFRNEILKVAPKASFVAPNDARDLGFIIDKPWRLVETKVHHIPAAVPLACGIAPADNPGCNEGQLLEVLIEHEATRTRVRVYNIHNWYRRNIDHGGRRWYVLEHAMEVIGGRRQPDELPPILLGDFNNPTSETVEQECLDGCNGQSPPKNCTGDCWDNKWDRQSRLMLHGGFVLAGASEQDARHQQVSQCVKGTGGHVGIDQVWLGRSSIFTKNGPDYSITAVYGDQSPAAADGTIDLNRSCGPDDPSTATNEHHCVTDHLAIGYAIGWGCSGGSSLCGDKCYDFRRDANNCGACGTTCSGGKTCRSGQCACPEGTADCGSGKCVMLGTTSNCLSCGDTCRSPAICTPSGCAVDTKLCTQRCEDARRTCNDSCSQPDPVKCNVCVTRYNECVARCG